MREPKNGAQLIRRVVALPHDNVQIARDSVTTTYNDGTAGTQHARFSALTVDPWSRDPSRTFALGADDYFVLADSAAASLDSRHFGSVMTQQLDGVVVFTCWPPSHWRRWAEQIIGDGER